MHRLLQVLLVLAVVALTAGMVAGVAAAEEVYTVDEDTELDDPDSIAEYHEQGTVHADVSGLDMTVTVSDDRREAGIDAYTGGVMTTYIQVEYREEIDRTVRIYIPAEYFQPRLKDGDVAENSDTEATFEPVAGGDYTAVTIQFRGETDATFSMSDAFGHYLSATDRVYMTVENATGVSPPRLGARGHTQWQYPPEGALSGENATYHIPADPSEENQTDMTIQYDNTPDSEQASWMTMPKCSQDVDPVCVTDRDGDPVLFSTSSESVPPIRYKHGTDRKAQASGALEELRDSWSDLLDGVGGLFGTVIA